jgi:hypothetical protein
MLDGISVELSTDGLSTIALVHAPERGIVPQNPLPDLGGRPAKVPLELLSIQSAPTMALNGPCFAQFL